MKSTSTFLLTFTCSAALVLAQDAPGGWRRATDPAPAPAPSAAPAPAENPAPARNPAPPADASPDNTPAPAPAAPPAEPLGQPNDAYGQPIQQDPAQAQTAPAPQMPEQEAQPAPPKPYGLPARVTLKPGTYVTVRLNEGLTTDHNQVGDSFSASLMQPVIVDGVVIANRGQIVYGRISELQKQKSDNPSRLGLQLTGMTLADGTQVPLESQLVTQQGRTTPGGVQAGTVAGTTGAGAVIGGMVGWGTGAAIGAGAGAAAGLIGVLLTRHHATVLYPETPLTFQITTPLTVSTSNNPQAFRFVGPEDYNRSYNSYSARPGPQARPAPAPAPYYYGGYGYPYPYYAYPYPYWGPSVWIGGGWGWGGWGGWGGRWGRWR